ILLGRPDLFQHAGDEPAPHLGRHPQRVELLVDRVPHLTQGGGARDRRSDETGHEQCQPDQDARADRVEPASHYRATSVTSRPSRTTPMTTVFPATSPLASNAIDANGDVARSEEHTSELQSPCNLVCRLLLEKKKYGKGC